MDSPSSARSCTCFLGTPGRPTTQAGSRHPISKCPSWGLWPIIAVHAPVQECTYRSYSESFSAFGARIATAGAECPSEHVVTSFMPPAMDGMRCVPWLDDAGTLYAFRAHVNSVAANPIQPWAVPGIDRYRAVPMDRGIQEFGVHRWRIREDRRGKPRNAAEPKGLQTIESAHKHNNGFRSQFATL